MIFTSVLRKGYEKTSNKQNTQYDFSNECSIFLLLVLVDLSAPVPGEVVDGLMDNFNDLDFTSSQAKVEAQWKDYYDPESNIKQYDVQVSSAQ